jgi:hypothetical protein
VTLYFFKKNGEGRLRLKGSSIWLVDAQYRLVPQDDTWTSCSFWQYYFPTWFPLTQQQKEVTDAPCSYKTDADDHQTYDPDFAVG